MSDAHEVRRLDIKQQSASPHSVEMLYQAGDLSSKEACEALGVSRREF